jgi:hypothetical protein
VSARNVLAKALPLLIVDPVRRPAEGSAV